MRVSSVMTAFAILLLGTAGAFALDYQGKKVPVCGGFPGFKCEANEWCDFPQGTICGGADQFGTCRPRPDICTEDVIWVCGCDGQSHTNACKAAMAGVDVAHPGKCDEGK